MAATNGDLSPKYCETREGTAPLAVLNQNVSLALFRHGEEIGFSTQSQSLRMARAKGSRSRCQGPLCHRR
jgi:hypothetical protein